MPSLVSAAIDRVEYHDGSATMLVVFRSGGAYLFHDVPRRVYERIVLSPAPGRTFHRLVADRYQSTPYDEPLEAA